MPSRRTDERVSPQIELSIGGMTCASCAALVERRLNKLDGVRATVNYATEKARVAFAGDISAADLVAQVEAAGYTAGRRRDARPDARGGGDGLQLGLRGDQQPAAATLPMMGI